VQRGDPVHEGAHVRIALIAILQAGLVTRGQRFGAEIAGQIREPLRINPAAQPVVVRGE